jgi:hypothetical protein
MIARGVLTRLLNGSAVWLREVNVSDKKPPNFRDPSACANCTHVVWDHEIQSMCCRKFIIKLLASTQCVCDDYEPRTEDVKA